jgi:tripartite-type tricarboxylate transporter receptor subunit TctC
MKRFASNAATLALAIASFTAGGISTAVAADYYKGKTVTVQVPSGSGGTYHVYCQLVARHIGPHIPGNPKVIIQNLPGAGGAKSASYMMNVAPKNGSYIAMVAPGVITDPLIRKHKFDARKFQWLGSVAARPFSLAVWHTVPVKSIEDLKKTQVVFGTNGKASAGYIVPAFVNAVLGTKIKIITGYKSGGQTNLAMERGEVQGRGNYYSGFTGVRPEWITKHMITFVLGIGPRHPALKDVPHLRDLIKPGTMESKMYDLIELNFNVGQAFYTAPGVPAGPVAILRKAFSDMLADPELQKDIAKRRVEYQPQNAAQVEAKIAQGFKSAEPAVVKRLRGILTGKQSM